MYNIFEPQFSRQVARSAIFSDFCPFGPTCANNVEANMLIYRRTACCSAPLFASKALSKERSASSLDLQAHMFPLWICFSINHHQPSSTILNGWFNNQSNKNIGYSSLGLSFSCCCHPCHEVRIIPHQQSRITATITDTTFRVLNRYEEVWNNSITKSINTAI